MSGVADLMQAMASAGASTEVIILAVRAAEGGKVDVVERRNRPSQKWKKRAFARVAERDGLICAECGAQHKVIWRPNGVCAGGLWGSDDWEAWRFTRVNSSSNLELDHRLPLSEGGGNEDDNLWLLCVHCHKEKTSNERSWRLKRLFAEARRP